MAVGAYTTALMLGRGRRPAPPAGDLPGLHRRSPRSSGAIVGVAAARLHGPYLAGATLALAVGLPGLALYFRDTLGGEQGLRVRAPQAPDWFRQLHRLGLGQPADEHQVAGLRRRDRAC